MLTVGRSGVSGRGGRGGGGGGLDDVGFQQIS